MTDNKKNSATAMSDDEIIKAFVCCHIEKQNCIDCPAIANDIDCVNIEKLFVDVFNRLKADKEALIAGQETLQKALAERNAEIERLLTEFARLKEETIRPYLLINCDDKSGEVLRKVIKNQNAVCIPDNGATVEFLDKASIKAEAIKECLEWVLSLFPEDKNFTTISRFTVKRKLKEMVGESNV